MADILASSSALLPMFASCRPAVAVALPWCMAVAARSASEFEERITALYRPMDAEQLALSPDGEYLAYTRNERGELAIYIMAVGVTDRKFKITIEDDRPVAFGKGAVARVSFISAAAPAALFANTR